MLPYSKISSKSNSKIKIPEIGPDYLGLVLALKWSKIDFWVFAKYPSVDSGGISSKMVGGGGCWRY